MIYTSENEVGQKKNIIIIGFMSKILTFSLNKFYIVKSSDFEDTLFRYVYSYITYKRYHLNL